MTDSELLFLLGSLVIAIVSVPAWCMLAKRLGYDAMAGLLMLIPVANLFVFFYWAFTESPTERKLRSIKAARRT